MHVCNYACIFLRKTYILANIKDYGHRTRDGGTEDGKQSSKGLEQWNRATEKGKLGVPWKLLFELHSRD
jgi:hypothetical protein